MLRVAPTNFLSGAVREMQPDPLGRSDAGLSPVVDRTPKYGQSYDKLMYVVFICPFDNILHFSHPATRV